MYDVITIGSALTDIFVKSSQFNIKNSEDSQMLCQLYGDKMEVDEFEIHTGGGGSNTAVGFARQGFRTAVVTEIGNDTLAKIILEDFHQERVATNLIIQEKREKTGGSVILIGADGGRSVMVHRGASSMLDSHDIPINHLQRAEWIHLSSISGRIDALQMIGSALQGNQKLSWNPGKGELELLKDQSLNIYTMNCKVFIVNKQEWAMVEFLQEKLIDAIPEIVVTDGKKGGVVIFQGKEHRFESKNIASIDDTGAGDAFGVGYVSARIRGQTITQAADYGVENASSVVQSIGAKAGLLGSDN